MSTKVATLADLYVRGRELEVKDVDQDLTVTVWIQKLNPTRAEKAYRAANAARARVLLSARDEDSDLYVTSKQEVADMDPDNLFDYIFGEDLANQARSLEAQEADKDEWSKEDRLQGLRDAWAGGMEIRYAEDPEDPEAKPVFEEMKRFADGVEQQLEDFSKHLRERFNRMPDEEVRATALDRILKLRSELAWLEEHSRQQVFLSVRKTEDHSKPYFSTRADLDELELEALTQLVSGYRAMEVDYIQGKSSEETPSS